MEEEQQNELAPPRYRYKFIKFMTLTVLFLALLTSVGFVGLKTTSSSKFCSSCHEMKPEYYTWKASTHSEVDCVSCHTTPGVKNLPKDKANLIVQAIKKETSTYSAPIRMPSEIKDSSCERCHNVFTREVTPSQDIIIPHDKHKKAGVECIQCHSGVAHGKIADRKMTYQTDYSKWDETVGSAAMADMKFIRPDMDTCMECHKARKVTLECTACHKTGMVPASHKKTNFKTKTHGLHAGKDLKKCDSCHSFMSSQKVEGLQEISTVEKLLKNIKSPTQQMTEYDYAKQNTFCKDCHSKRPPSHDKNWMMEHKIPASDNKQMCLACHNYQKAGNVQTAIVTCSSCHPSIHRGFNKEGHPIPLEQNQQITERCYTCHSKPKCTACHKE